MLRANPGIITTMATHHYHSGHSSLLQWSFIITTMVIHLLSNASLTTKTLAPMCCETSLKIKPIKASLQPQIIAQ